MVVVGWFLLLSSAHDELDAERDKEPTLKADYRAKLGQAVNLNELRKQKLQVEEYVTQLEKQLPGKAEMDALLSDINQAGLGRGLQFELFRPGQVVVKDYYAELPIAIRVTGRYHDIGAFAADIANLSRIVTLHNLSITTRPRTPTGLLTMEATARTYRYLDANEVEEISARPRPRRTSRERRNDGARARLAARCRAAGRDPCGRLQRRAGRAAAVDGAAEARGQAERRAAVGAEEVQPAGLRRVQRASSRSARKSSRVALKQEARQPNSLLAAEINRRKEPLEAYPLDSMSMVGSVVQGGRPYALLRVDNLLYQVKVGDYLGQNYGKITKISETDVSFREIVQDAAGEWIERTSALQLQEKAR